MNKIACLTTGGTIVSVGTDKGLVPGEDVKGFNGKLYDIINKRTEVDFVDLYNIDSSDILKENFQSIVTKINEIKDNYDGFVIIHGTDTMAYTASVLSYMIKGLQKPIILTGSMIPMVSEGTDATNNIINSFKASINSTLFGVYISFGDKLILGNKSIKLNTKDFRTFDSPNLDLVGNFLNNELFLNDELLSKINQANISTSTDIDIDEKLEGKVFLLKLTPGMDYSIFDFLIESGIKGLVIEGFGDGNVPSNNFFKSQIQKCIDSGMNIILKSQCISGTAESKYAGGRGILDLGCISGANLTSESAYTKLMWAIKKAKNQKELRLLLNSDINGDLL